MLLENAAGWKYEYIDKGRAQGIPQGIALGREQGIRQIVQILLENRLGTLPEVVTAYIELSDIEALKKFALFANKAPSMPAITDHIKQTGLAEKFLEMKRSRDADKQFLESLNNWMKLCIQKGEKIGREEGKQRGEVIACRRMLRILLIHRFGTIPESVNFFIASSDSEQLTSLFHFALKAPSVQAITDRVEDGQALF